MVECKICGGESKKIFDATVLKKYGINYYQCTQCSFIQTETPSWLAEAYASAITNQDIGLIYRNINLAPAARVLIKYFFNAHARFLDYGGGYGMFVRMMRDRGYDFYRYDTYCENIFASGFDDKSASPGYGLVTAFEVFEHLENPLADLEEMLRCSRNIFFSTELLPAGKAEKNWWYVMPETGQHISLFSRQSLEYLAKKYNLHFYTNGTNVHLLTEKKISGLLFRLAMNRRLQKLMDWFKKDPESLLMKDYDKIKA